MYIGLGPTTSFFWLVLKHGRAAKPIRRFKDGSISDR